MNIRNPPSTRTHNPKIPLKPDSMLINVRPYRYTYEQKNEIDKQIKELLDSDLIQNNHNPYASLVLLIKKEDNSWHMYIDYKQLNNQTIKDKYPIPISMTF